MKDFDTTSVGDVLRAERLRQGKDLATVAAETKICCAILQAIERNQFDGIPGGSYRPHFLSQYAQALQMDEAETIAAFHQQYQEPELPLPKPPTKRSRSWRVLELGWVLTTVAAVLGVYKIAESLHTTPPWKETGIMARLVTAKTAPKPSTPPGTSTPPKPQTPAPVSDHSGSASRDSAPAAPVRVAFTATEPVWMSVKCDGQENYTGTLIGPETRTFEAQNAVNVLIGNAGGVTITLNGRPIGPVGAHGEIKSLELTPSGVHGISREGPAKTVEFKPKLENPN